MMHTVHQAYSEMHDTRYTIHDTQYTIHDTQYMIHTAHDVIQTSQPYVPNLSWPSASSTANPLRVIIIHHPSSIIQSTQQTLNSPFQHLHRPSLSFPSPFPLPSSLPISMYPHHRNSCFSSQITHHGGTEYTPPPYINHTLLLHASCFTLHTLHFMLYTLTLLHFLNARSALYTSSHRHIVTGPFHYIPFHSISFHLLSPHLTSRSPSRPRYVIPGTETSQELNIP